jgi:hypothetical protein
MILPLSVFPANRPTPLLPALAHRQASRPRIAPCLALPISLRPYESRVKHARAKRTALFFFVIERCHDLFLLVELSYQVARIYPNLPLIIATTITTIAMTKPQTIAFSDIALARASASRDTFP